MTQRYLLCPGQVRSRRDGDFHFIGASRLAHLYGVRMSECVVLDTSMRGPARLLLERVQAGELVKLEPCYDGDYGLAKARAITQARDLRAARSMVHPMAAPAEDEPHWSAALFWALVTLAFAVVLAQAGGWL